MSDTTTPETVTETPAEATAVQAPAAGVSALPKDDLANLMPKKTWAGRAFDSAFRFTARNVARVFFGARFKGMDNFKQVEGKPLVIIANHTSYLDAVLMGIGLPVQPAFAMDIGVYEKFNKNPLMRFFLKRVKILPIDSTKPQAIKTMAKLAASGQPVMIFPEGRLTSTGSMMQIFDGAGMIADAADAYILPVHVKGLVNLPFARQDALKNYPRTLFPEISLTAVEPRKLELPEGLSNREKRKVRHAQIEAIMRQLPLEALDRSRTIMDQLHFAGRHYGMKTRILEDHTETKLTYSEVITGAYALGNALKKITTAKENVGFLLPNSNGAAVTFWALQAYDRVPTMLNASADQPTLASCVQTASLKTVLTSRNFVKMAKLEDKIAELEKTCKIVYLEDIKEKIGPVKKLMALAKTKVPMLRPNTKQRGNHPAVILFTSGSEGVPKGVVLSSTNILANIAQVTTQVAFTPNDKLFNALPMFHSFGLGGGMLMPMLTGVPSFQFVSPLEAKTIPKLIYFSDSTVMFGTDTFLSLYARSTESNADMNRLRLVFAGAEALTKNTYDTYIERFGVKIYQGYGMTEASPVVAINSPANYESGTVGKFVPGMQTSLEPVQDMDDAYRLSIKGPNVMLGYLKNDNPGVLYPPAEGWHDTGDIVTITEKGFVKIAGRAKRFAKIGGEMVSLDAIESIARTASPQLEQAAILRQQDGQPDAIVLFTTDAGLKRDQLGKAASDMNRSVLGLPKNDQIRYIEAMPKLATGKTDYVTLKKLDAAFNAAAAKPAVETVPAPAQETTPEIKAQQPKM